MDLDEQNKKNEFVQVVETDSDNELRCKEGDILPILTMRNMMLFPGVILPVHVGRPKSMKLIKDAFKKGNEILACTQFNPDENDPNINDVYHIGCIANVVKIINMPDDSTAVILHGKQRGQCTEMVKELPYMTGKVTPLNEILPKENDIEFKTMVDEISKMNKKIIKESEPQLEDISMSLGPVKSPVMLVNFLCSNVKSTIAEKIEMISEGSVELRAVTLMKIMQEQIQILEIKKKVRSRVKGEIDRQQRDFFIREEIKNLQHELSDHSDFGEEGMTGNPDIDDIIAKGNRKKWNLKTLDHFNKELLKLEHMNPQSPDYQVQYAYLQTMLDLPWNEFTTDTFNLLKAEKIINKNHYGMEKAKERILEYLAVLKLKGDLKSPIICLYGPPGVGKTSLGKSVAETLGRKYARVSLGGVSDESEIRGHRKTYIGAMPGRIISNIAKCGSSNPVFVLDEIDKLSRDAHGDPSSALLEVLDPEQNSTFHDNYLDTDFDLSNVLFIATANDLGGIPRPLLDRMELIEISGYVTDEKEEIAIRHLIPQELEKHGITKKQLKISRKAVRGIIDSYTRESGVRMLDKQIAKIMRKSARSFADNPYQVINVTEDNLKDYLGISHIDHDEYDIAGYTGVVTGLAWTQVGGEILFIESALSEQKECKLSMTGSLGDVMKESAQLALEYIKSHTKELGIDYKLLNERGIHIHVPDGATPKDGPSAGITILTAMVSSLTGKKVKNKLAMSGEISLRGKLLPVGGIKEKVLAAKRAGIKDIILCVDNRKDVDEINEQYLEGLEFHFVRTMQEALSIALCQE
ncbi:MAG: endopeptidase La [Paludibacteraceae bacterium]|nr:endopeptidase La [Paludibacteraceae bacterium]